MGLAITERAALADLFDRLGPDAPTLCEGWLTRDLAAHVVIRERRPDAGVGIVVPAFAGRTASVQARATKRPFADLVKAVRTGPPVWNPMGLGPLNEALNALEFLVHHEDVLRAEPGWEPRSLPAAAVEQAWERLLAFAKLGFHKSTVGVVLRRPDGQTATVKTGSNTVTLTGDPVELVMLAYGRHQYRVRIDGDPDDVASFQESLAGR